MRSHRSFVPGSIIHRHQHRRPVQQPRALGGSRAAREPTPPGGRSVGRGRFRGVAGVVWPEAGRGSYTSRSTSGGFGSAAFSCSGSRPEPPAPPGPRSSSRSGLPDCCLARSRPALRSRDFPRRTARRLLARSAPRVGHRRRFRGRAPSRQRRESRDRRPARSPRRGRTRSRG